MTLHNLYGFYDMIEKLKLVKRYSTNTRFSESTAEHSWRLAMMVMATARELDLDIDLDKSLRIALVHDLPEIITGDIPNTLVFDGNVTEEEKNLGEKEAIQKVTINLSEELKDEIVGYWEEYERRESKEARFVRVMDKLEALSHMLSVGGKNPRLDHAVQYADDAVRNFPELKPLLKLFKEKLKVEFEKAGVEWKSEYENVLYD